MFLLRSFHLKTRFAGALIALTALTCSGLAQTRDDLHHQTKILGGYFEEWSIYYAGYNIANLESNGVASKLTHLIYAFANVTSTPTAACALADTWADYQSPGLPSVNGKPYTAPLFGNFGAIQQLKGLHPNLKTIISLGGASAANTASFVAAASTEAGREALASSCITMFIEGNIATGISAPNLFDGINIDWEFPTASDTQNFTLLLKEFRKQLDALSAKTGHAYQLSFDGPAGSQNYSNIDLLRASEQVDYITIDGYNYAGSWDTTTNHASPLFDSKADPDFGQQLDINETVDAYLSAGVPPEKYLMGLPLYGAGWTGVPNVNHGLYQTSTGPSPVPNTNGVGLCPNTSGSVPGCDVLLTPGVATFSTLENLRSNGFQEYFDPQRIAVWLYDPTAYDTNTGAYGTFYTYDSPGTALLKMLYIDGRRLGGAYVWALKDDDANGTMVKTMAAGLKLP